MDDTNLKVIVVWMNQINRPKTNRQTNSLQCLKLVIDSSFMLKIPYDSSKCKASEPDRRSASEAV